MRVYLAKTKARLCSGGGKPLFYLHPRTQSSEFLKSERDTALKYRPPSFFERTGNLVKQGQSQQKIGGGGRVEIKQREASLPLGEDDGVIQFTPPAEFPPAARFP